jgi:hypothetical protein
MLFRQLSFSPSAVLVSASTLSQQCVATVNPVFGPIFTLGFGAFPAVQHSPFAASGSGSKPFACAAAFPPNPSNPAINPTGLTAVGLFPR